MSIKSKSRFVAYAMVLMTLLVLGCTSDGTTTFSSSDKGVVISEFQFDTASVYHKEDVNLRLVLENQGEKQVTGDTSVFIYGQSVSSNVKHWQQVGAIQVSPGTMADINSVWSIPNTDFLPPQPEMGVPGGVATFEALLKAPELEQGESTPYTFFTRVCYPYKTSMLATVTSSSRDEMKVQQDTSAIENINTAGPVHVTLGGQSNIIARGTTIPVIFKISDVGGGFSTDIATACAATPVSTDRDKVMVSIEVEGFRLDGTSHTMYGNTITTDCTRTVKLIGGEAELRCSIPIDPDTPSREYHIRATAEYKYYIGSDSPITVDYIIA
ncbi:MAG: hypothetical protein KAJ20_02120 [Candidatus Aenigmarchaeota archaeon]|nr:hypothetical protein [Candidatus Aenigmarchaeota archaeon]